MGVCNCSMFCCTLLYVHFSIAIILMGKRELIALLNLSSWCLVMVERLFLTVPRGCLQFVIVVFPDHTHLLLLLNSTTEKRGFTLINKLFLVFFGHNDHHGLCLAQNKNRKYRRSACTCFFQNLSKLPLSSRIVRMSDSNIFFRCYQTDKMSINKLS